MKVFTLSVLALVVALVANCGGGLASLSSEQNKEMKECLNTLQKTVVAIETGSISRSGLLDAKTEVKLSMERAKLPEGQLKNDINAMLGIFDEVGEVISELSASVARRGQTSAKGEEVVQKLVKKYPSSFKAKDKSTPELPDAMDALAIEARKAYEKVAR
jgi:hypothetical protein